MTNREWLESLSDEKLANYINNCKFCAYKDIPQCYDTKTCVLGHIEWLQAEHEETDDE